MASNNGASAYHILWLPEGVSQLQSWATQATNLGLRKQYAAAIRRMKVELKSRPGSFGDYLWRYQKLQAIERRGIIPKWFFVWYGVDDRAHQIVVRSLMPAPGSPLT